MEDNLGQVHEGLSQVTKCLSSEKIKIIRWVVQVPYILDFPYQLSLVWSQQLSRIFQNQQSLDQQITRQAFLYRYKLEEKPT